MNKSVRPVIFAFVIITVLLSGCASSSTPIPLTYTTVLTETPLPTNTPMFTNTPIPPTVTIISSVTPTPTKLPPTATITSSVTPIPQATSKPSKTVTLTAAPTSTLAPTNSVASSDFAVLTLTSPVSAGSNATVRIQTLASVSCFLSYTTPFGTDSEAAGLGETTADAQGVCSWTWKISPKTKAGTGNLTITANGSNLFLSIVIQ